MMLLVCIGVIPVELVMHDVLARVGWPGPLESDSCFANIGSAEVAWLGGNACENKEEERERAGKTGKSEKIARRQVRCVGTRGR